MHWRVARSSMWCSGLGRMSNRIFPDLCETSAGEFTFRRTHAGSSPRARGTPCTTAIVVYHFAFLVAYARIYDLLGSQEPQAVKLRLAGQMAFNPYPANVGTSSNWNLPSWLQRFRTLFPAPSCHIPGPDGMVYPIGSGRGVMGSMGPAFVLGVPCTRLTTDFLRVVIGVCLSGG